MLLKENAIKCYYDLIEKCKIEDVNCKKYNYHHIEPLFTLKEKFNISQTLKIRGSKFDVGDLLKCSIYHHVLLHYYLCFMFDKGTELRKYAKVSFNYIIGKTLSSKDIDNLLIDELNSIAILKENVSKTNVNEEDIKLRNNRLCLDPRYEMKEINYFVGKYVSYGTLFSWIKWQKEQEHNIKYKNITSCDFCNQYLVLDECGNTLQFDEKMNDEYREIYNNKHKEKQKLICRNLAKNKRKDNNVRNIENLNLKSIRHRMCKDPRYNKIIRDSQHKPYAEYTNYYNLYEWAKLKLSSKMNSEEKELLKGFNKPEDFAKFYLLKDENGNFIEMKVGNKCKNKNPLIMSDNDKNRLRYCKDPRYGKEFQITEYTHKTWDKKVCTKNSLSVWYDKHKDDTIVENLNKKDFINKYILIDNNGNYIYNENEALKYV